MEIVFIFVAILFVIYKLGLFNPILDLTDVASRESAAYNREHKSKVAKRYERLTVDLDIDKVNENIKSIDSLKFDWKEKGQVLSLKAEAAFDQLISKLVR